eukprot:TRINITY_DN28052_c0_g1_i1.p1 TRINITY_DN28052_c0_g1~~TRINITY_DN28052_c0_g1_i1.p1  ORF type:complete len:423 (-),score=62.61 TRINITY_DN28052_c0_g1_i1:234-1502(-)
MAQRLVDDTCIASLKPILMLILTLATNMAVICAARLGVPVDPLSFAHITDPQLGMLNWMKEFPTDIYHESSMFEECIKFAKTINPAFIFIGGDMQNWWPNEPEDTRNRNFYTNGVEKNNQWNYLRFQVDLGREQRAKLKAIIRDAKLDEKSLFYTPGNHDVGDDPDEKTLADYVKNFEPHYASWTREDVEIHTVRINSQLYWTKSDNEHVASLRAEQEEFLRREMNTLKNNADTKKFLIVMTHICPFLQDIDETTSAESDEGWGHWRKEYRSPILAILTEPKIPVVFVCGHMHVNVNRKYDFNGVDVHIRVTSSAGTTMNWNGLSALGSEEASVVASKPVDAAFNDHIISGNFANIPQRLQAHPKTSGMRLFKFFQRLDQFCFTDKWFTVSELSGDARKWHELNHANQTQSLDEVCITSNQM